MLINQNAVITVIQMIIKYDHLGSKHGHNRVQPFHYHLKGEYFECVKTEKKIKKRGIQVYKSESLSLN